MQGCERLVLASSQGGVLAPSETAATAKTSMTKNFAFKPILGIVTRSMRKIGPISQYQGGTEII